MAEQVTRRWRRVATAYETGGKRESEVNVCALMCDTHFSFSSFLLHDLQNYSVKCPYRGFDDKADIKKLNFPSLPLEGIITG